MPQVKTASGPITLTRCRGRTNLVNGGRASIVPSAVDAMTAPVAIGPPPILATYGAAIPAGTV